MHDEGPGAPGMPAGPGPSWWSRGPRDGLIMPLSGGSRRLRDLLAGRRSLGQGRTTHPCSLFPRSPVLGRCQRGVGLEGGVEFKGGERLSHRAATSPWSVPPASSTPFAACTGWMQGSGMVSSDPGNSHDRGDVVVITDVHSRSWSVGESRCVDAAIERS
jgi:hypothetical protein